MTVFFHSIVHCSFAYSHNSYEISKATKYVRSSHATMTIIPYFSILKTANPFLKQFTITKEQDRGTAKLRSASLLYDEVMTITLGPHGIQ